MRFTQTALEGVYLIGVEPIEDERGFFARTWCRREFGQRGLVADFVQCNVSYNRARGTLRGMHYQAPPHEETKVVSCIRGAIYDVVVDLRPESPTYRRWIGAELTEHNRDALYVPAGCAHGFQTLADDSEVFYQISAYYAPEAARGVRWDDPAFGIRWPEPPRAMSERDRSYPDYAP
ncbi:MAG TPA: dTDP-4-dehydrorhamnose 3,5-epimerase [Thermomicrobiales bacterium]|nr:dTDP-4-dehydrorhamnose 3,5-epimerase [Thermomicrobiales bacterium]